jgi:hypothetical protein
MWLGGISCSKYSSIFKTILWKKFTEIHHSIWFIIKLSFILSIWKYVVRELLNLLRGRDKKTQFNFSFTFVSVDSLNLFFVCIRVCLQNESIVFTRVVDTEFSLCFFLSRPRGIQLSYLPNNPVRA